MILDVLGLLLRRDAIEHDRARLDRALPERDRRAHRLDGLGGGRLGAGVDAREHLTALNGLADLPHDLDARPRGRSGRPCARGRPRGGWRPTRRPAARRRRRSRLMPPLRRASTDAVGRRLGSSIGDGSPPWAVTISRSFASPTPARRPSAAIWRPSSGDEAAPPSRSISPATVVASSTSRASDGSPRSTSIASRTSSALPMQRPSGRSMSVTNAVTRRPAERPMSTISSARVRASSRSRMKAPRPCLTSSTIAGAPPASFLLMTLLAISGMLPTVPVTSRRAYSLPSAGARSGVWPAMAAPVSAIWRMNRSGLMSTESPANDSSLSSVPPVKPRPRPESLATATPSAATSGTTISESLSPTPPVLCLSTTGRPMAPRSSMRPEVAIRSVRSASSWRSRPWQQTAISQADDLIVGHVAAHVAADQGLQLGAGEAPAPALAVQQLGDGLCHEPPLHEGERR